MCAVVGDERTDGPAVANQRGGEDVMATSRDERGGQLRVRPRRGTALAAAAGDEKGGKLHRGLVAGGAGADPQQLWSVEEHQLDAGRGEGAAPLLQAGT